MARIPTVQARAKLLSIAAHTGLVLDRPNAGLLWIAYRNFARIEFDAPVSILRFATRVEADARHDFYSVTLDRLFCDQPLEVHARQPNIELCYTIGFRMLFDPDEDLLLCHAFRTSHLSTHNRDFFAEIEKLPVFPLAFADKQPLRVEVASWGVAERTKEA